ncbi:SDR family NAD(P)-dependent oxidoreductase [Pelagibacterium lacus]|uniref:SDR family NAD(P)-dependent oxidoreductase n=2 Tax=Pelagibacterium lacus TaxID=2282655 RepID=A0A369W496_9HYPH|nr:SDR family NAD(P)-dependent oxidoreductase [Pelagibacterium lacus]
MLQRSKQSSASGRLEGKVAFITGAASGIGRAAAQLFAAEGAKVAVVDLLEDAGRAVVDEINANGGSAITIAADITDPDRVEFAVNQTMEKFGKLNIVYNNAGGSTIRDDTAVDVPLDEFWRAIKLDLFGCFLGCRFGIPAIIASGGGAVVNTTSNVALMGFPGRDGYTAAKGGVAAITRSLAVAYAKQGVRVNAVAPATTRTERAMKMMAADGVVGEVTARQLLGIGEPIDIAEAALYLASDASRMTTGSILLADSGTTIS